MSLMYFPYSQLAIRAVVLALSRTAVHPYVGVISATKAYNTHQPGSIQQCLPYGGAKCFLEEEIMFINP